MCVCVCVCVCVCMCVCVYVCVCVCVCVKKDRSNDADGVMVINWYTVYLIKIGQAMQMAMVTGLVGACIYVRFTDSF